MLWPFILIMTSQYSNTISSVYVYFHRPFLLLPLLLLLSRSIWCTLISMSFSGCMECHMYELPPVVRARGWYVWHIGLTSQWFRLVIVFSLSFEHFLETRVTHPHRVVPASNGNRVLLCRTSTADTLTAGAAMMFRVYNTKLVITTCARQNVGIRHPVRRTCNVVDKRPWKVHD